MTARAASLGLRRHLLETPLGPLMITFVAASIFVVLRLDTYDWNPTGFVHAGDRFVHAAEAPQGLLIREHAVGFDGTGFYRLALDPATRDVYDHGIVLDLPAFRQQRILYPSIVWAASGGGRPNVVPWALIAVNIVAFAGIGWVGSALAIRLGRPAWWGLALPAYPGFAISLGLDTAEILAALLALTAVLLLLKQRTLWAGVAFTAAMLTRETTLLIPMGYALAFAWQRLRNDRGEGRFPIEMVMMPGIVYALWQVVLWRCWDALPLRQGGAVDISLPLVGFFQTAPDWPSTSATQAAFQYLVAAGMIAYSAATVIALRRSHTPLGIRVATILGLALAALYSDDIWLHHWGFLRAFTEAYLLGMIVILASSIRRFDRFLVGASVLWAAIALNLVLHP